MTVKLTVNTQNLALCMDKLGAIILKLKCRKRLACLQGSDQHHQLTGLTTCMQLFIIKCGNFPMDFYEAMTTQLLISLTMLDYF